MMLDERERLVLETLQKLPKENIVLIGGYALNAYVPPRFSIDCDLVVLDNSIIKIETILKGGGFVKAESGDFPLGSYMRYEKRKPSKVSFDLQIGSVFDRDTNISFEIELFRKYSAQRTIVGKVTPIRIEVTIADPELLFAMKFVTARRQDIRDTFMLASEDLKWSLVTDLVLKKCDMKVLTNRVDLIRRTIDSERYRDSLQGPYGKIPDQRFETCKKNLLAFLNRVVDTFHA